MRLKVLRLPEFSNVKFCGYTFLFNSVFSVPACMVDTYRHIYSTVLAD